MSSPRSNLPVLILGAGINGAAVARELVLNDVPVIVVDTHDIASGATSRSSRLIHGGLRYLEYGDFALVRESLTERERLLRLAPQFVRPLRLFIPVRRRFGGLLEAARRFLGREPRSNVGDRGLWTVRWGLRMYDFCARGRRRNDTSRSTQVRVPASTVHAIDAEDVPRVDRRGFRWLCAYSDAQMAYPERFVVAMLEDARQMATSKGIEFAVYTYHRVTLDGDRARIDRVDGGGSVREVDPAAILNASGAAGDLTLEQLGVPAPRMFGGTKGSHFVTFHEGLRRALGPRGIYAEAPDGRLVFVLPFGDGVLVGTTDEFYDGDPDLAVATEAELDYLLDLVRIVFPDEHLTRGDIALHYAGVRPLPRQTATTPASVSRRHAIVEHPATTIPAWTLVGGKLTTCRQFAEEVVDKVLRKLDRPRLVLTRDRPIPGGENHPADADQLAATWLRLSRDLGRDIAQIEAVWRLCGTRTEPILRSLPNADRDVLADTHLPAGCVRWVIENEWVSQLEDLVERRLLLVFQPRLSRRTLEHLAEFLIAASGPSSRAASRGVPSLVADCEQRLGNIYGRTVLQDR